MSAMALDGCMATQVAEDDCGGDSMMQFVKGCMTSILQPFNESLKELNQNVGQLRVDLTETAAKLDQAGSAHSEQAALLAALRADRDATQADADRAHARLDLFGQEKAALEEDHENSKARVASGEKGLLAAQAAIVELQKGLRGMRTSIARFSDWQAKVEIDFQRRVNPALTKLGASLASLDDAHQATAESLKDARGFAERFHSEFQEFARDAQANRLDESKRMDRVDDQFVKFGIALKDTNDVIQGQGDHMKTVFAGLPLLRQRVDKLEEGHQVMHRREDAMERATVDLDIRCNAYDANFAIVNKFLEGARGKPDVFNEVEQLKRDSAEHGNSIGDLQAATRGLSDQLQAFDKSQAALKEEERSLEGHVARLEALVGINDEPLVPAPPMTPRAQPAPRAQPQPPLAREKSLVQAHHPLEPLGGAAQAAGATSGGPVAAPSEAQELAATEQKGRMASPEHQQQQQRSPGQAPAQGLPACPGSAPCPGGSVSLISKQRTMVRQLEDHSKKLDDHTQELQKQSRRLDTTEGRVDALETTLAATNEHLRNLNKGVDLTHEYWKGLSKGLHEISYKGCGESDGLPKGPHPSIHGMRLPTLGRPKSRQSGGNHGIVPG